MSPNAAGRKASVTAMKGRCQRMGCEKCGDYIAGEGRRNLKTPARRRAVDHHSERALPQVFAPYFCGLQMPAAGTNLPALLMPKSVPTPLPDSGVIEIRGVRQNNLKGFDLDLPLGKL